MENRIRSDARIYLTSAYRLITFPGVVISLTFLGMNLPRDGMRDALAPRMSRYTGGMVLERR